MPPRAVRLQGRERSRASARFSAVSSSSTVTTEAVALRGHKAIQSPPEEMTIFTGLLTARIPSEYSLRYERTHGPPRTPRSRTKPRLRLKARLRHLLRERAAITVRPGIRDPRPSRPRRK